MTQSPQSKNDLPFKVHEEDNVIGNPGSSASSHLGGQCEGVGGPQLLVQDGHYHLLARAVAHGAKALVRADRIVAVHAANTCSAVQCSEG